MPGFRRWLERLARGDGRLRHLARPSMIHQDDLHGLRPFRPGDSPRWIHWRTSARRNEKMVREFERASGQNLIVVVDCAHQQAPADRPDPQFEELLSLAATICWEWGQHNNDQLFLLVADREPVIHSGPCTRERALAMLNSLALVGAGTAAPADTAMTAISHRLLPDAPVVLLSLREKSPLRDRLVAATNRPVLHLTTATASEFYRPPSMQAPRPPVREPEPTHSPV